VRRGPLWLHAGDLTTLPHLDFRGMNFCYSAMPNGIGSAPRLASLDLSVGAGEQRVRVPVELGDNPVRRALRRREAVPVRQDVAITGATTSVAASAGKRRRGGPDATDKRPPAQGGRAPAARGNRPLDQGVVDREGPWRDPPLGHDIGQCRPGPGGAVCHARRPWADTGLPPSRAALPRAASARTPARTIVSRRKIWETKRGQAIQVGQGRVETPPWGRRP